MRITVYGGCNGGGIALFKIVCPNVYLLVGIFHLKLSYSPDSVHSLHTDAKWFLEKISMN